MQRLHTSKLQKVGNSIALIVPREILAGLMWERGDYISFGVIEGPTLVARQISDAEIAHLKPTRDIKY